MSLHDGLALTGLRITDYGDAGLILFADQEYSDSSWNDLRSLAIEIEEADIPGCIDVVPAYDSVLVLFDYTTTDPAAARLAITRISRTQIPHEQAKSLQQFRIPMVFGGAYGPDLRGVAEELALRVEELITQITDYTFTVRCLAGPLAQPLFDAPQSREVRRLVSPRSAVPPGSLGMAGHQSTVYTARSPGGWALVGRTPVSFFDVEATPPVPYQRGDYLEFFEIAASDWQAFRDSRLSHEQFRRSDIAAATALDQPARDLK